MWEQLTDAARAALNSSDNFGRAEVPFSDEKSKTISMRRQHATAVTGYQRQSNAFYRR
ncbi:hypothetical protein PPTG_17109 [Phytophthora nicotianae INRA-310]|uniref:Uncharacterized protein n=2 Tax=Phytophthora nicotianae TaxID=4792 RepID=W2PKY2_PHYN3|nr:hypothetical protein PPTG_17109 [Phytophthora nicotianae INRA-310]ETN01678.1 hypothetical protein PPTG_17109 [Phytophthora nicotianae INRA-310]